MAHPCFPSPHPLPSLIPSLLHFPCPLSIADGVRGCIPSLLRRESRPRPHCRPIESWCGVCLHPEPSALLVPRAVRAAAAPRPEACAAAIGAGLAPAKAGLCKPCPPSQGLPFPRGPQMRPAAPTRVRAASRVGLGWNAPSARGIAAPSVQSAGTPCLRCGRLIPGVTAHAWPARRPDEPCLADGCPASPSAHARVSRCGSQTCFPRPEPTRVSVTRLTCESGTTQSQAESSLSGRIGDASRAHCSMPTTYGRGAYAPLLCRSRILGLLREV